MKRFLLIPLMLFVTYAVKAQDLTIDPEIYQIIDSVSADRLESDIRTLAGFAVVILEYKLPAAKIKIIGKPISVSRLPAGVVYFIIG